MKVAMGETPEAAASQLALLHRISGIVSSSMSLEKMLDELIALKGKIWAENPARKVLGKPLLAPDEKIDSDSDEVVRVCRTRCYYMPRLKKC